MDLVAEMLLHHLQKDHADQLTATRLCPPMRRRFSRAEAAAGRRYNADRFVNRFWDYPRVARRQKAGFDLFHVIDHSYGQLLHELPPDRTVVTCHDLDTFQSVLNPAAEPRSIFFRKMMERTLTGFRQAARVTCDSVATRDQLLAHDLVDPERVVVVHNGVHPSCSPEPDPTSDLAADALLGETGGLDLLHVGSTIPRKRIDVLLQVFAALRKQFPAARLIRAGGSFTNEQARLVDRLELGPAIVTLPRVDSSVLAAFYRRAALVLQPSEREGFGLPVVEAMACGTPVVASDIPALREVGGEAAAYCPIGDVSSWVETIVKLLSERELEPPAWSARRTLGLERARKFSWAEYANKMVAVYRELL